jgi:hypothetical protein
LYGSSRLGVKTHKRELLRKEFSISGFSESGEVVVDEIIDSLVYVPNENYFCRVLGQKQFELANHTSALLSTCLGNVLATVLDRRTAVYHPQADTFLYFSADVVNATMYYPFGQAMMSYKNEDFVFSYGLNGQEKEDDIFEGAYSAEYWMYDSRLGRRWNLDPRPNPSVSVYACFGNNPILFTDLYGDTIKVEGADKFKQETFKYLQTLTNDLLNMDKNGIIYIVEGKQGSQNTDKSLVNGTALIQKLNKKGGKDDKMVLIKEGDGAGSRTQPRVLENKTNGIGTSSVILFDLNQNPVLMSDGTYRNDPNIVLGHELFHASHNWDGTNKGDVLSTTIHLPNKLVHANIAGKYYKIKVHWMKEEEIFTRHQENELRAEQGMVNRFIQAPTTYKELVDLLHPLYIQYKKSPLILKALEQELKHIPPPNNN